MAQAVLKSVYVPSATNGSGTPRATFPEHDVSAADEQLLMSSIFSEVKERYGDFVRKVELELNRKQIDALANMVRAHQMNQFFYSAAGEGYEAIEQIVRTWVGTH